MDEEAAKAIEAAMRIVQQKAQAQPEGATPEPPVVAEAPGEEPAQEPQEAEQPASVEPEREAGVRTGGCGKRRWPGVAGLMACVISVTVLILLVALPLVRPAASVTIIPAQATVTVDAAIQVTGRALPTVTLSQAHTVQATGTGHQDAQAAHGGVTFYNGYTETQTIPAGTLLQSAGGVQMVTDAGAVVPPANPPTQGQATVPAHALETGPAGNIKAYSIYGACCRAYILVENTAAFTGGQQARTFQAVTQGDLDAATNGLKTSLMQSVNAAFEAQLQQGEASAPPDCAIRTASDHGAGEEGAQASVTVTATCAAQAYQAQEAQAQVMQSLTVAAGRQLGDGYVLIGDPRITVTGASANGTMLRLDVKAQATMAYRFGQGQLQAIRSRIAGMDKAEAAAWLARQRGVKAVSIEVSGGASLPQDVSAIRCILLYAE